MLREKNREDKLFYQFSLDSYVPEDHFLRQVIKHVSFKFIREKVKHLYSRTGKPAIDPVVLIKMMLIGYFYDIKSERQLEKEIQVNLAYRWFIGYDIDERIPDHSVISQTRRRKFSESNFFQEIFDEIVDQLIKKGLIDGHTILTDSTHIKANASMKSMRPTKEYLATLDQEQGKKKEEKISNKTHFSKTDPESKLMNRPGKPGGLHYLEHRSVDSTGFITDVFVTPGNESDHIPYIERVKRQIERFDLNMKNCVADKGYGYLKVYQDLMDLNIDSYIPFKGYSSNSKYEFKTEDFHYESEHDRYICPEGKFLKRGNERKTADNNFHVYRCSWKDCKNCPTLAKCNNPDNATPKSIKRSVYQDAVDYQLSDVGSDKWKQMLRLRKWCMEGSFADAKNNHGLRRANMRGICKVQEQALMTAVVQNIKRMMVIIQRKKQASLQTLASLKCYFLSVFFKTFSASQVCC